jgi:hypothetical protein
MSQQPIQPLAERVAGRIRKVGGRHQGLQVLLRPALSAGRVPLWVCRSTSHVRSLEGIALSRPVKPTLATASQGRKGTGLVDAGAVGGAVFNVESSLMVG